MSEDYAELKRQYENLKLLRNDAKARGMDDLVVTYGWALMDMGQRLISHPLPQS